MGLYILESNEKELLKESFNDIDTSGESFDLKSKFEEYYVMFNNFINCLSDTRCVTWVTGNCDLINIIKLKKKLMKNLNELEKINNEFIKKSNNKDEFIYYSIIYSYLKTRIHTICGIPINTLDDLGKNLCNNFSMENNPILKLEKK